MAWFALLTVLVGLLCLTSTTGYADDKQADDKKADDEKADDEKADDEKADDGKKEEVKDGEPKEGAEEEKPAPERKPICPDVKANPKDYKELVEAARAYFDLDEQRWKGRKDFLDALTLQAGNGKYWLADMEALRWLTAQARSFYPPFTDRKWRNALGIGEYKSLSGTLHWIKSEYLTCAVSIPRKYPKEKDFRTKYPRVDPYPVVLAMHEKRDYTGEKYPGEVAIRRLYPKKQWSDLYEDWLVLCPVAAAGNYLREGDMLRAEVFQNPYAIFWKHYHVDFERVILDGSEQAFAAARTMPMFFAGIVFRSGKRAKWELKDDVMKADVKNFASVPVYVVDDPKLAEQLKAAGHPDVTAGIGGPTLFKWMQERRRVEPKEFEWVVQKPDQVLPYWVNLDSTNWDAPERSLQVKVVDTETEPNTVKITARGINSLSLFLNDDVVDLDDKVRVVINGHIEYDRQIEPTREAMKPIKRDFDVLFDIEPIRIRNSMFFGWLKPARIVQLQVRPPKVEKKPENGGVTTPVKRASPEEEDLAKRQWDKAQRLIELNRIESAVACLDRILGYPLNEYTEKARTLRAKLTKEDGDAEKGEEEKKDETTKDEPK